MAERFLVIGYGSMGRRHAANLRALRPGAFVYVSDPDPVSGADYTDLRDALGRPWTAAIIASPQNCHASQINIASSRGHPVFCEKPLAWHTTPGIAPAIRLHTFAVGFQYRFNRSVSFLRAGWQALGTMDLVGRDNLTARYGASVAGTMASHAIDMALWTLGPAQTVDIVSDGVILTGSIQHERGLSTYEYNMAAAGGRVSRVNGAALPHDEDAYRAELAAWLDVLDGRPRDGRLATFADGLAVDDVIRKVRRAENV